MKYYWFTFADGYRVCARGFSRHELSVEERNHGKLVKKETISNSNVILIDGHRSGRLC